MKTLCVFLAATILTVTGDSQFRPDYDFYEIGRGWFKFHKIPTMWPYAELQCYYEASPLDDGVKDVLIDLIRQNDDISRCGIHLGIHNTMHTAKYTSIEGVPLVYMPVNYRGLFPPDYDSAAKYCVRMLSQNENENVFLAGNCTDPLPYVCYKKKTAPLKIKECGTIDKDYHLERRTGHCYKFHSSPATWSEAFQACDAEGGHLAIINRPNEAKVFKDIFGKFPPDAIVGNGTKDAVHLGYYDWYDSGLWRTIFGQSLTDAGYAKWAKGEPNHKLDDYYYQYCGAMNRAGLLEDTYCAYPYAFICEKDPHVTRG